MTKRIRTIAGFLMGLFMVLSIMAPSMAMATEPVTGGRPDKGDLIIHKLQYNTSSFDMFENDGLPLETLPEGTSSLPGVRFDIYQVADDETSLEYEELAPDDTLVTDENGKATFLDLDAGRYLVVENLTDAPDGIEYNTPPFLVDVPMMNPDGRSWNSKVHVYPKNQLILGDVELIKWQEQVEGNKLDGAVFSLYKEDGSLVKSDLTTTNGMISVSGLEVGKYYFMETSAPAGFGLDQSHIDFEITTDDHGKVLPVYLVNYELPMIEKSVDRDSASFKEPVKWTIEADVPTFIDFGEEGNDSVSYVIEDTMDPELIYQEDLTIAGLTEVDDYTVEFSNNVLTIDFNIAAISGLDSVTLEFTTLFDKATTPMGEDIENNVKLTYYNGFKEYTDTSSATVYTSGRQFRKVVASDPSIGLDGAKFVIKNSAGKYLNSDYAWVDSVNDAWEIESKNGGYFEIKGLAEGSYFLEETVAPHDGDVQYRLSADIPFVVDKGSYGEAGLIKIENSPEITLPQTGGVGTLVFSIIGLGLMGSSVKLYKKSEK